MKTTGLTRWNTPNTSATNESGFSALPGGVRANLGTFAGVGDYGFWWSATPWYGSAYYRSLYANSGYSYTYAEERTYGFSVRCLRD